MQPLWLLRLYSRCFSSELGCVLFTLDGLFIICASISLGYYALYYNKISHSFLEIVDQGLMRPPWVNILAAKFDDLNLIPGLHR